MPTNPWLYLYIFLGVEIVITPAHLWYNSRRSPLILLCPGTTLLSDGSEEMVPSCNWVTVRGYSLVCPHKEKLHVPSTEIQCGIPHVYFGVCGVWPSKMEVQWFGLSNAEWHMGGRCTLLSMQIADQWTCIWAHWAVAGICQMDAPL